MRTSDKALPQLASATSPETVAWPVWNRRVLASLIAILLALPVSNLLIDPYDVFEISPIGPGVTTNQRFQHVHRLLDRSRPIDILLMGDSVMGINDPIVLAQVLPGKTIYNASFFMATVLDIEQMLAATLAKTTAPTLVVVGLDPLLFVEKGDVSSAQMRMPPEVTGETKASFFRSMLLASSAFHSAHKLLEKVSTTPSLEFDRKFGHYRLPELNTQIQQDHAAFVDRKFRTDRPEPSLPPFDQRQFEALSTIEDVTHRSGVRVAWVIQPTSWALRRAMGEEMHRQFINSIRTAVHGQVVDLSELGGVTDDPYLWYDAKHYLPSAGSEVLRLAIGAIVANGSIGY